MKVFVKAISVLLLVSFLTLSNSAIAKGKGAERLSDKEAEAFSLYEQGHYKEACELYIANTQSRNDTLSDHVLRGLVVFFLIDIIGILLFLYVEKRKAYRLLVDRNTECAKRPVVNTAVIEFSEPMADGKDQAILEGLQQKLEVDKVYLDSDLTIESLSMALGTNRNVLSKLVNHHLGRTFPALVNQYRVNEAIRLLGNPSTQNYTIEAIAQMCGYNNRQVFHNAFKKETGLTPVAFREVASTRN